MSAVTVTVTIGGQCHYWLTPQPELSLTGSGLILFDLVHGSIDGTDNPLTLELNLDDSVLWDIRFDFRNAPPIVFEGLNVTSGGDLFEQLTNQGWTSL